MNKQIKTVYLAIGVTLSIAAFTHFLKYSLQVQLPDLVLLAARLVFILTLIWLALKKKSLTTWILVSMVIGAEIGHDLPEIGVKLQIFSNIFLRLIKTIIAPLLFATLVVGIAGHSNLKQVGRMGWKSILYFEVVSTIALFIGLIAINVSKAGVGITLPVTADAAMPEVKKQTFEEVILHIFPENIAKSIYSGEVLQIVVFSIIFGIAVAMMKEDLKKPIIRFSESLAEAMFKFTNIVMLLAPIAVGAAIAYTVGHMGLGILSNLFKLLLTLYVALAVFVVGILVPIAIFFKIPIKRFMSAVAEPATIAFATSSSESALPRAMESMEAFGVPRKIVAFVLPTGYSFNLDGTTLYLSLASIFVAQAAGIQMSFDQQLIMMVTLMLTSKGVAGVSRASLVILLGTAATFGLPVEPIFILLGIDALMDMARTSINVIGNCLASAVIARWEGELNTEIPLPEN
jgi:proton glutamate symport protein